MPIRPWLFIILFPSLCFAEAPLEIPDVTVTAPVRQGTTTHRQTIDRKAIAKSPSASLTEVLQQQANGVLSQASGDNTQAMLTLRGFGDNAVANTLLLEDGFPVTNPSLLAPNLNAFTLADLDHIEILQGSAGSLWGDQAVGGVVDLITRRPQHRIADLTFGWGSYQRHSLGMLLGNRWSNGLSLKVLASTLQSDNFRAHNQQDENTLGYQLGLDYAQGVVLFDHNIHTSSLQYPGPLTEQEFITDPRQASEFQNQIHYRLETYRLLHKHLFTPTWRLETRLARREAQAHGFVYAPFQRAEDSIFINPRLIGHWQRYTLTTGFDTRLAHYTFLGAKLKSRAQSAGEGLYGQLRTRLSDRFEFTLGARTARQADDIEVTFGQPTPVRHHVFVSEQGLSVKLNPAMRLFLRRDGNFRFPKTTESTWLPAGTTALLPQRGVSYETGVEWQQGPHRTKLSLYRLDLTNEIAFDPTQSPLQPFGAYHNLAQTVRKGLLFSEELQATSRLKLGALTQFVDARFAEGPYQGRLIPAIPALTANLNLAYRLKEHWRTLASSQYLGRRFASEDPFNEGRKLGGYWIHNLALQYEWRQLLISFDIQNLFDKRYAIYTLFDPSAKTNSYYPGCGRSYLLTAKLAFD